MDMLDAGRAAAFAPQDAWSALEARPFGVAFVSVWGQTPAEQSAVQYHTTSTAPSAASTTPAASQSPLPKSPLQRPASATSGGGPLIDAQTGAELAPAEWWAQAPSPYADAYPTYVQPTVVNAAQLEYDIPGGGGTTPVAPIVVDSLPGDAAGADTAARWNELTAGQSPVSMTFVGGVPQEALVGIWQGLQRVPQSALDTINAYTVEAGPDGTVKPPRNFVGVGNLEEWDPALEGLGGRTGVALMGQEGIGGATQVQAAGEAGAYDATQTFMHELGHVYDRAAGRQVGLELLSEAPEFAAAREEAATLIDPDAPANAADGFTSDESYSLTNDVELFGELFLDYVDTPQSNAMLAEYRPAGYEFLASTVGPITTPGPQPALPTEPTAAVTEPQPTGRRTRTPRDAA